MTRGALARIGVALLAGLAAACGMTTQVALGPGRPSVGVEIFANDTREPALERRLHHEMSRAVQRFVDGPLVRPGSADLVLRGRITDLFTRAGVRDRDNRLREQGITIELTGELVDRRTGERRAGPVRESVHVGFLLEQLDARAEAIDRALGNLAEALVLDLASHAARDDRPLGVPREPAETDPHAGHDHGPAVADPSGVGQDSDRR